MTTKLTNLQMRFLPQSYLSFIIFVGLTCVLDSYSHKRGCTAPLLLPHKPFLLVWNHPSYVCEKHGINIDFARWGIVDNSKDSFIGEQISLLYRPGQWPYYSDNSPVNGGIPQLGNVSLHLERLKTTINLEVPHQDFSGLGVIDFEKWRPLYWQNFDSLKIYQEKSVELAKQKHPSYNKSQILNEAVKEFEQAARSYINESLRAATSLRPNGQWGYYGYPRCWDENCNSSTISINDRMNWVFKASSGLYPSIYFHRTTPSASRADMISKRLKETLRVKAKWTATDTAIFPYAFCQDGPYSFFTKHELDYSVKLPADLGSSGVVLWGSSSMAFAKNECLLLQDYVNSTLGPYSKQVMDFFSNCSSKLCSGHGRCVRKDYEAIYQGHLAQAGYKSCRISPLMLQMGHKKSRHLKEQKKLQKLKNKYGFKSGKPEFDEETSLFPRLSETGIKQTPSWFRVLYHGRNSGKKRNWFFAIQQFIMTMFESIKWLINQDQVQNEQFDPVRDKDYSITYSSDKTVSKDHVPDESRLVSELSFNENLDRVSDTILSEGEFDSYICKCFGGWSGPNCDIRQ